MNNYQATIKNKSKISGIGIHTGSQVQITFCPAPENQGITFFRTDINKIILCKPDNIIQNSRATCLIENEIKILTPEHLLAACFALGITNLVIEIDQEEVPILDGSAKPFIDCLFQSGIEHQLSEVALLILPKPYFIKNNTPQILALPFSEYKLTYILDYPNTFIGTQIYNYLFNLESFISEIAAARTFGFYQELKPLLEKGLAQGATLDNAVVIGEYDYMNPLRFPDELVRHKILDMIGDFAILNRPIQGHFIGIGSGHTLNAHLIKQIIE